MDERKDRCLRCTCLRVIDPSTGLCADCAPGKRKPRFVDWIGKASNKPGRSDRKYNGRSRDDC